MTVLSLPRPASPARRGARGTSAPADVDIARLTRYRGGTYSHTVDTVVFTDGSSARTDLIRLNPNIEAYSLDFTGHAPTSPSHYRAATWSAVPNLRTRAHEAEVDWILRNSFPALRAGELSRRLRAAGYPLGAGQHHRARGHRRDAGRDLALHQRPGPRQPPAATCRSPSAAPPTAFSSRSTASPNWAATQSNSRHARAVSLILQKSVDGRTWRDVAASGLNVEAGKGTHRKALGVGSTVSRSRHGRRGAGLPVLPARHPRRFRGRRRARSGSG